MNIEFLKSLLLDPYARRTPAQATLASWFGKCNTGIGGDNVLRAPDGLLYVIGDPEELKNLAIQGRISVFGRDGLRDCGAYKIAPDGRVERVPEQLRDVLWSEHP